MQEIIRYSRRFLKDRFIRAMILTFRSANIKLKMSKKNTLDLFMEFVNSFNLDIPDGADLIDGIGKFIGK